MKNLKKSIYYKIAAIVVIALLLTIPVMMIENLIYERKSSQSDAINEVSSLWANSQTLCGPYLTIPFIKKTKQLNNNDSTFKYYTSTDYLYIMPTTLFYDAQLRPEKRYRGIYEVIVYKSDMKIKGSFSIPDLQSLGSNYIDSLLLDQAFVTLGIDDLRGIEEQVKLKWNGSYQYFNPGVLTKDIVEAGIYSDVNVESTNKDNLYFEIDLHLKGSQSLNFTPVGKVTDVTLNSTWNNPKYAGAFLPDYREITTDGFTAKWNVLHLNRNYPQAWIGAAHNVYDSKFGVDLFIPVDNYHKSIRAVKYAILFIAFTFIAFFFIEILNKIMIHPIQYILVGVALTIFFVLLLSISEYLDFDYSFIIAAFATLLLISAYVKAILKSSRFAYLISSILFILYTFIFVIIQLQDLALLIGSIGLFVIMAIIMYLSRKIDWYNINIDN